MRAQIIRRRVLLGGAVSALAFTPSRTAQADTPFANFGFAATGAPTARTMPDRLAEVVNVLDWGAKGDGSTDDSAAIQAAIDYCLSTKVGTGAFGGKIFFPPGGYKIGTALNVGSDTNPNARVIFEGVGKGYSTSIESFGGGLSGFLISKGNKAYDALQGLNGIDVINASSTPRSGAIRVTGTGVHICNTALTGMVLIDASQADGCFISDVSGGGTDGNGTGPHNDASSTYPSSRYGVGIYLGNNTTVINCRLQFSLWCAFAVTGIGASILGCSAEAVSLGARFGWQPPLGYLPTTAQVTAGVGNQRILTFASVPSWLTDALNAGGTVIVSGIGMPDSCNVVSTTGTMVTISADITDTVPSGTLICFTVDAPAIGATLQGFQTEATDIAVEMFNAEACLIQGNYHHLHPPQMQTASPIQDAVRDVATGIVTVTTPWNHNISPTTANAPFKVAINPGGFTSGFTYITYKNATQFTYGPIAPPSGSFGSGAWMYPQLWGIRFRKVSGCAFLGNVYRGDYGYAAMDFDYGSAENPSATAHKNNFFASVWCEVAGMKPPTDKKNVGGWTFLEAGLDSMNFANPVYTAVTLNGLMAYGDLPGNGGAQPGPIEGQEYIINNCSTTTFGAAADGAGANHVKVRHDGSGWKVCG
jgi:Pectate lyase superfamily protein